MLSCHRLAGMVELVDTQDLKFCGLMAVRVRFPLPAQSSTNSTDRVGHEISNAKTTHLSGFCVYYPLKNPS